jgi:hypothetical protein
LGVGKEISEILNFTQIADKNETLINRYPSKISSGLSHNCMIVNNYICYGLESDNSDVCSSAGKYKKYIFYL